MMAAQRAAATPYQHIVRYAREELGLHLEDWQHRVLAATFGNLPQAPEHDDPPALFGLHDFEETE